MSACRYLSGLEDAKDSAAIADIEPKTPANSIRPQYAAAMQLAHGAGRTLEQQGQLGGRDQVSRKALECYLR